MEEILPLNSILKNKHYKDIVLYASQILEQFVISDMLFARVLDVILRYSLMIYPNIPPKYLYFSAYFIILRHPFSYPTKITRESFVEEIKLKYPNYRISTLDWYLREIIEKLKFVRIHDPNSFPYYIDPISLILKAIDYTTYDFYRDSVFNSLINKQVINYIILIDQIIDSLLNKLKILPKVFEKDLRDIVKEKIPV